MVSQIRIFLESDTSSGTSFCFDSAMYISVRLRPGNVSQRLIKPTL